ncbi:MAG: TrbC/VirB2 family protein [Sphingomonas sp.]|uniref:TrbC/VirB2 family protein n=1 Tax=Sphingomonas sp. TaxID=28214 RepID=UPI002275170D|nr:TrbC/VirB2 family protein [Sphingomonas sp.]MCX8477446.1 TrbC/VirB2 family protein [Sphingomonas sp.]
MLAGFPSSSQADPTGSSAVVAAVQWLEGTVLGTIATTLAVIAVASVGLLALSGRMDLRRAATVILGCFVLFGASSIVAGLESLARAGEAPVPEPFIASAEVSPLARPPIQQLGYDPYAGAAVPMR